MDKLAPNIIKYSIYSGLSVTLVYCVVLFAIPDVVLKEDEFIGRIGIFFASSFGFFSSLLALIVVASADKHWLGNVADLKFQLVLGCLLSTAGGGYLIWTKLVEPSLRTPNI